MKVSVTNAISVLVLSMSSGIVGAVAMPADIQLLSLVPPDSKVIAGAIPSAHERLLGNFVIFTEANSLDLDDFLSLAGADSSLVVRQLIFTATAGRGGAPAEHSLLVSGVFDAIRIYKSASASSIAGEYRGVRVMELRPFERERGHLRDDRLLAIIDGHLAIFGTITSAHEEIDRYLDRSPAEALIVRRVSKLRDQDETWCVISSPVLGAKITSNLRNLDPLLGEVENSGVFLYGIRYGRQIEFEYVVEAFQDPHADSPSTSSAKSFNTVDSSLSLISSPSAFPGREFRRVVKISRGRYGRWLTELTLH